VSPDMTRCLRRFAYFPESFGFSFSKSSCVAN
jgi:hypothetical protein